MVVVVVVVVIRAAATTETISYILCSVLRINHLNHNYLNVLLARSILLSL